MAAKDLIYQKLNGKIFANLNGITEESINEGKIVPVIIREDPGKKELTYLKESGEIAGTGNRNLYGYNSTDDLAPAEHLMAYRTLKILAANQISLPITWAAKCLNKDAKEKLCLDKLMDMHGDSMQFEILPFKGRGTLLKVTDYKGKTLNTAETAPKDVNTKQLTDMSCTALVEQSFESLIDAYDMLTEGLPSELIDYISALIIESVHKEVNKMIDGRTERAFATNVLQRAVGDTSDTRTDDAKKAIDDLGVPEQEKVNS